MVAPYKEPAFPNPRWEGWGTPEQGMTLRDYFAAKAMQGFIASDVDSVVPPSSIAQDAYDMADEMMKVRNQ